MNRRKISRGKYILSLLPAVAMMVIIFIFSSKTAVESDGSSRTIAGEVIRIFEKIGGNIIEGDRSDIIDYVNHIVRKGAHMTVYAVLAIPVCD